MPPPITVACIPLKLFWKAVCQPFLIHFRRLSSLCSGSICSVLALLLLAPLPALRAADNGSLVREAQAFDVRSYGAVGDGQTVNTASIQKAIDACHATGGGRVVVPEGVFVAGSLRLKSRVTLKIDQGGILRGSPQIGDYTVDTAPLHWGGFWKSSSSLWKQCLIYAEDAEQITIEGPGTIDGQGGSERKVFPNHKDPRRPMLVRFERCRRIAVRDVTLLDPAVFTTFFVHSEDIAIERVTIRSRKTPTSDGLDFDGCKRVRIADCDLDSGDDAIALKTLNPDWPNEDFEISGCRITSRWCAIRVGAESIGAIRRLNVRDCVFTHCQGGIKIESNEGAQFEDLSFSGIEMKQVCQPFMVLASRFAFSAHSKSVRPPVGRIRNVRFKDIRVLAGVAEYVGFKGYGGKDDSFERLCSAVVSLPGTRIEDVSFTNINITFPGGGAPELASRLDVGELLESFNYKKWAMPFDGELPASALYLRHVKGVRLTNVRLAVEKPDARAFIAGDDVDGLTLQGVVALAPLPVPGLAKFADTRDVTVKDSRVECGAVVPPMVAPTAEELRRLAQLRTRSAALDREIQQVADHADASRSLPRSLPAAEGVDPAGITQFLEAMEARRFELHSFMLLRHGKVVAETWWAPYAPQLPHCLYSLSKSFTSSAVGLAAAEGKLSLDDKVISFFPESLPLQVSDHLAVMRVRDLLCMAAGHEKDPQPEVVKSDDWVRAFLAQPLVRAPGTQFVYSSAATYMCSAIVQKATGMTVLAYLEPRLFEPLGITGVTWDTCPRGINTGGWGLSLPTEGLAKFGQLYLQKGNWQGRQILPAAWVAEATSFQIQQPPKPGSTRTKEDDDQRQGYGFQFWRCRHNAVRGDGAFGQLIVMMPDQDAVVVMTSESRDMMEQLSVVWQHLLPALRDVKLPADDAAQEKLTRLLSTRHLAPRAGVAAAPGARSFALEENSLAITRLAIANTGQTVTLTAKVGDTEHSIVHGLGEWRMGETAMPGTPTRLGAGTLATPVQKVAASAAWLDASTLELTWRYLEFPHRDTVTCRFDADRVTVSFLSSITVLGRGAPNRPTLIGTK